MDQILGSRPGKQPSNIGFFSDSTLQTESDISGYRDSHDSGYDDCIMRMAVANVPLQTYCLLGKPGEVDKFNCQDWSSAVRREYNRLVESGVDCDDNEIPPSDEPDEPDQDCPESAGSCPPGFKPYMVEEGDNCWTLWRSRTNKDIPWEQAETECGRSRSGDPGNLSVGEEICISE